MLFRLDRVGKEFGGTWLFREVTAQANPGDRIGLIGRNGVGKTTLFSLIDGRLAPDAGTVHRAGGLTISRVEQIPFFDPQRSLLEETLSVFADLAEMERRMRSLEARMAEDKPSEQVVHDYEALKARFEYLGGYDYPARTESVLFGLGFSAADLAIPCAHLSGGQRSRMSLARALLRPANLLLLDEPINHLDLAGILWLTGFLRSQPKALVVISHDRRFLDQVTEKTWEMEAGKLFEYPAPFSRARILREERLRLRREAWERQQEWRRRTEEFIQRNIAGQKTRQAQSRRKQLQRTEWIEPVEETKATLHLRLVPAPRGGSLAVELEEAEIGYPHRPLLRAVSLRVGRGERVGIVGGNGTGKTTLLRCLAGDLPLLGGRVQWGYQCLPAYFAQEARFSEGEGTAFDVLSRLMPGWSDEEIRTFAARFGFRGEDIFKPVSGLSGGERSRLAFARLLMTPCNLLILDEPTNHLDIAAREALEAALGEFQGALVVVSHDLYFLERVVNRLLALREGRLEEVPDLDAVAALLTASSAARKAQARPVGSEPQTARSGLSKNERQRLEWRLQEVESRIEALERRRTEVEEALHSGSEDHVRLRELALQYESLEGELKNLYAEWEQLGMMMER
jgi:ATP-binding cassette subfamily F protein 3